MPATVDPDVHKLNYVNGTNAATRLAGMDEGGAAWLHPDHWLAAVGKDWLAPAVGGQIPIDYHLIEWLFSFSRTPSWNSDRDGLSLYRGSVSSKSRALLGEDSSESFG